MNARNPRRELAAPPLPRLPGQLHRHHLDNGLTVCLLRNPQAPIVTTALWYRAGSRDEDAGHTGAAHFLEHMLFKGAGSYGPGDIDRRTELLGGTNNAFTSHDATVYYFNFAREHWTEALAIEAARLTDPTLDPVETDSERQVILEEILMYQQDPWDALDCQVQATLFAGHPYGHMVLGTREDLLATGPAELRAFHHRLYRPSNAVLVVAGDVPADALEQVERYLGSLPADPAPRQPLPPPVQPAQVLRVERHHGEVARLMLALPAPPAGHPHHPLLRLLMALLTSGRSSRLYRALVDEGQLCVALSGDVNEATEAGMTSIVLELVPGVEPARVEAELLALLAASAAAPPTPEELGRAKHVALADWVFAHERIHQQALTAGFAQALFGPDHVDAQLRALAAATAEELQEMARQYLDVRRGAVIGWSLPDGSAS